MKDYQARAQRNYRTKLYQYQLNLNLEKADELKAYYILDRQINKKDFITKLILNSGESPAVLIGDD